MKTIAEAALAFITALLLSGCNYLSSGTESPSMPIYSSSSSNTTSITEEVIPGSSNPAHILENISLFDFELTDREMSESAALDRNEKHDWY